MLEIYKKYYLKIKNLTCVMAIKDFVLTFFYNKYIMIMEAQNEVFNKILSGRLC